MDTPALRQCDLCRRTLGADELVFVLRIELFADPSPPVITKEDLEKDHRAEMEALIAAMEGLDPEEAQDEVHERYEYALCPGCRREFHRRLKFPTLSPH